MSWPEGELLSRSWPVGGLLSMSWPVGGLLSMSWPVGGPSPSQHLDHLRFYSVLPRAFDVEQLFVGMLSQEPCKFYARLHYGNFSISVHFLTVGYGRELSSF